MLTIASNTCLNCSSTRPLSFTQGALAPPPSQGTGCRLDDPPCWLIMCWYICWYKMSITQSTMISLPSSSWSRLLSVFSFFTPLWLYAKYGWNCLKCYCKSANVRNCSSHTLQVNDLLRYEHLFFMFASDGNIAEDFLQNVHCKASGPRHSASCLTRCSFFWYDFPRLVHV